MFTGIIEIVGRVKSLEKRGGSAIVAITANFPDKDLKIGDSVSINGVCLTVTSKFDSGFSADIGDETFKVTSLSKLSVGDSVNLERAMQMGGRLGGHLVQGHVDGIGKVLKLNKLTGGLEVTLEVSRELSKYLIKRGSVAIDGVSLTATDVTDDSFKVFLIPHTVSVTTFKDLKVGDIVNLEVDIIGKYVEKLTRQTSKITEEFLKDHGF